MPDETGLPADIDLDQLPGWAQVVFALRCAQRIRPLFTKFWPDAPEEHAKAIDEACKLAQDLAKNPPSDGEAVTTATEAAHNTVVKIATAAKDADAPGAANVANAVSSAVYAAQTAAANDPDPTDASYAASYAAAAARDIADIIPMTRHDYERLKGLAKQHRWTNESPVDVALLGPLWPDGAPEGWPLGAHIEIVSDSDPVPNHGAPLSLYFDAEEFSPSDIATIIERLSDLYQEVGGDRLIIDSTGVLEIARIPEVAR